jgi:hypothetical protein
LEQDNKSRRTIQAYTDAVRLLADYCDHVRAFIADRLARCKPTTAHQRYRSLRSFSSGRWKRRRSARAR